MKGPKRHKSEKKANRKEIWIVIMATHTYTHTKRTHSPVITATMWISTIGACALIQSYMDLWRCVRINNKADKRNPKLPLMPRARNTCIFGSCDRLYENAFKDDIIFIDRVCVCVCSRQSPFSNNLARYE